MFKNPNSPWDEVPQFLHEFLLLLAFLLGDEFWQILTVLFRYLFAHLLGNLQEQMDYSECKTILITICYDNTCLRTLLVGLLPAFTPGLLKVEDGQ